MGIFGWIKKRIVPEPIEVRFYPWEEWKQGVALNGIYHAYWWATGDFPIKLMPDGTGIMVLEHFSGSGKPYPGFSWRKVV